jgi:hypothetical protein
MSLPTGRQADARPPLGFEIADCGFKNSEIRNQIAQKMGVFQ